MKSAREHIRRSMKYSISLLLITAACASTSEPDGVREQSARADEPMAAVFLAENAAKSLDASAAMWLKHYSCLQCHAAMMHPVARRALARTVATPTEVQAFVESSVREVWPTKGVRYDHLKGKTLLMHGDMPPATEPISFALGLAYADHDCGKVVSPTTRAVLLKLVSRQRSDGGFNIARDGVPEMLHEFDQALLAAIAIGIAPGGLAQEEPFKGAVDGIRRYIREHPASCAWQRGMMLWAEFAAGGFLDASAKRQALKELLALQRPDGGWALPGLLTDATRQKYQFAADAPSDGYATGFVIYVARQSGVAKDDPRLQRGVSWLKTHQRQSGRWFLASLVGRKGNFISNAATAWAVLGLHACDALPPRNSNDTKHPNQP